jgi:glycerol-1-phosphate dehydrogenase [NAD(P)+]
VEPIDRGVWDLVQPSLREALSNPAGVKRGDPLAIRRLVEGLMMGGFAMQASKSSRPASGAEHQFSHLWDMQHHTHNDAAPPHGFKVGVATLAITRLYEWLFSLEPNDLAQRAASRPSPEWPQVDEQIRALFPEEELRDKALLETKAKYVTPAEAQAQRELIVARWPKLRERLRGQLVPQVELSEMLRVAGAPERSEQIGIFFARLRDSHRLAYHIRRRYTVLDLAVRMNVLDEAMAALYPAA